ncbi:S-adenosyl-L-methionine-dependent methyltransferase [Annulohypoxylon moriforme]|nr:S-adenosyl-L-methionine-dependent methyltransferase [Annulohypoxylon moriforme]
MSGIRCNVRNILTPRLPLLRPLPVASLATKRTVAANVLEKSRVQASGPVAEQLAATGLWIPGRRSSGKNRSKGDKARVNIVSEKLCDDIFSYIGPGLDRHKGCDLIDIYPGAGLWSQKLHDYLEPRSHILMEPDAKLYEPFLKPLLDRPNTTLVPASGLVWRELSQILTPDYLPHQTVVPKGQASRRNDQLLVTANIAFHPKKKIGNFGSMANLVMYQFIDAIRTSSLFQQYGLVRMLIWSRHDDRHALLPSLLPKRKRLAIDGELSCEWIHEVCGLHDSSSPWFARDEVINTSSDIDAWKRMQNEKIKMPKHREPDSLKEARSLVRTGRLVTPGVTLPTFKRAYQETLRELEAAYKKGDFPKGSDEYKKMKRCQWRVTTEERKQDTILELMKSLDKITALHKSGKASPEKIAKLEAEWTEQVDACAQGIIFELIGYKDNLHYYRQDPPLLYWDRRTYESMTVQAEEFFPNIECSLLDIQPKSVHPLIRDTGPGSNRAGDCFELIQSSLMTQSTMPVRKALDSLMPGAADYIMPRWKSAKDIDHGGVLANTPHSELTPRMLNSRQWEELLELWMEWPFRPKFHELVARTHDEGVDEDSFLQGD